MVVRSTSAIASSGPPPDSTRSAASSPWINSRVTMCSGLHNCQNHLIGSEGIWAKECLRLNNDWGNGATYSFLNQARPDFPPCVGRAVTSFCDPHVTGPSRISPLRGGHGVLSNGMADANRRVERNPLSPNLSTGMGAGVGLLA